MDKIFVFIFIFIFIASALLTGWIRRYALRSHLLDIPGKRSSHNIPTPRGGGLAIVVCCLIFVLFVNASGNLESPLMWAFFVGGSAVALMGWIDDHRPMAGWRPLLHLMAAIWVIFLIGGFPSINVGIGTIYLGWFGSVLAVLGGVWLTNLYNFMDGIDGIAAVEAITVGSMGGFLLAISDARGLALISWSIVAVSAGFLVWNWPPAKIFMGNVGSEFLGFSFAILILTSERSGAVPVLVWLLPLGVFVGDATFVLIKRLLKGEKVWEAHRTHFYQRAIQAGASHRKVTITVIGINGLLSLLAMLAFWQPILLLPALGAGVTILVLFAHIVRAMNRP